MKSRYKTQQVGDFIEEKTVRNNNKTVAEVYSVTNSDGFIKSTDYFDKKVFSKNISNYKIVKQNQFAYNPSRINVGSIDFLRLPFSVSISPLYTVFECKKDLFEEYLLRYLKSPLGILQIRNKTRGAVRDTLTFDHLKEIILPLPSIIDQLKIVKLLSKVDSLIAKRLNSIKLIDDLQINYYLKLFGDPTLNSKQWKKMSFSKVATNENSKRIPINESNRNKRPGEYPYYGATGIIDTIDNYIFDGTYLLIAEDGKNLLLKRKKNAFIAQGKFWVNNHAHILSYKGIANLRYLEFFLNLTDLKTYLTGIDQVKLNKESLEKIQVPIPPLRLQNKFLKFVERAELESQSLKNSLLFLENLYSSLSYRAFRGELDLNNIEVEHIVPKSESSIIDSENHTISLSDSNQKRHIARGSLLKNITQKHFGGQAFSYEQLAEKIQTSLVDEDYNYHNTKQQIFESLKGKTDIKLKQVFNEEEKKVLLQEIR